MIYNKIKNIKLEYRPFKTEDLITLSYTNAKYSTDIILSVEKEIKIKNLSIQINFNEDIFKWRDHDYKWVQTNNEILVANDFVNKCIFFNDGVKVIPSKNIGLWKYNPKNKKQLIWVLEDKFLTPVIQFDKKDNKELIDTFIIQETVNLKLLFTAKKTPEFSRSKVSFSSILCFTDHCDFDSLLLLEKQRNLFKKLDIKITKGFFLNHFSKRDYNVSIEREKKHLLSWVKDGHELAYHSLTQSIRNIEEATLEFDNFSEPVQKVSTWIDHGFQPYNLTMLNRKKKNIISWIKKQNNRNIYNFWTYNDCGSGGVGIINQLNSKQFTPKRLINSLKKKSFKVKISTFIRSYIFHFSDDNKAVSKYKRIATTVKKIIYNKEIGRVFSLIFDGFYLFFLLLKSFIKMEDYKKQTI